MTKPVNRKNCCDLLSGQAKAWCQQGVLATPIVGDSNSKNIGAWGKFIKCRSAGIATHFVVRCSPVFSKQEIKDFVKKHAISPKSALLIQRFLQRFNEEASMCSLRQISAFLVGGIESLVEGLAKYLSN